MTEPNGIDETTLDDEPADLRTALESISLPEARLKAESCRDSDAERAARERLGRAHEAWQIVKASVGRRYDGENLDTFSMPTDAHRAVVGSLRKFVANISERVDRGEGLLLFGPKGTGKDHLAIACLREAARAGFTTRAEDGQSLFQKFRDVIGSDASEKEAFKPYTAVDVLLLSDPIPIGGTTSDYQRSVLWRIIDRRYRDLKPTWVTLNVASGEEAEAKLGAQIVDRLRDGATAIQCKWESFRKASA